MSLNFIKIKLLYNIFFKILIKIMNLIRSIKHFSSKKSPNFFLEEGEYLSRNLKSFIN